MDRYSLHYINILSDTALQLIYCSRQFKATHIQSGRHIFQTRTVWKWSSRKAIHHPSTLPTNTDRRINTPTVRGNNKKSYRQSTNLLVGRLLLNRISHYLLLQHDRALWHPCKYLITSSRTDHSTNSRCCLSTGDHCLTKRYLKRSGREWCKKWYWRSLEKIFK